MAASCDSDRPARADDVGLVIERTLSHGPGSLHRFDHGPLGYRHAGGAAVHVCGDQGSDVWSLALIDARDPHAERMDDGTDDFWSQASRPSGRPAGGTFAGSLPELVCLDLHHDPVRIVIWNMNHWQQTDEANRQAWSALESLQPDYALLQEFAPPAGLTNLVYRPIGGARDWGSAVVGFTGSVVELTEARGRYNSGPVLLLRTFPGSVAVARVEARHCTLTLVSMYGVIDDGYADTTVHRQLSDLVPLFDDPVEGKRLLLGGDLNITTQWIGRQARYARWEAATFARIESFGLVDCLDRFRGEGPLAGCGCAAGPACRHVRTQHHKGSIRPWQNDYAFASRVLLPILQDANVASHAEIGFAADHLPLIIELDV